MIILISFFTISSCEEDFDIGQETTVRNDDLFVEEQGFYFTLYGIYDEMLSNTLYGQHLTLGHLSDMAYDYRDSHFRGGSLVNEGANSQAENSRISYGNSVYTSLYRLISRCNTLLEELDSRTEVTFFEDNRSLLRAELIGLRGLFHFELLRLFAPAPIVDGNLPGIVYQDQFSLEDNRERLSVNATLNKILEDLKTSEDLLAIHEPLLTDGEAADEITPNNIPSTFGSRFRAGRNTRLNYFGVLALTARVAMYSGNNSMAFEYANNVINSQYRALDNSEPRWLEYALFGLGYNGNTEAHDQLMATYFLKDNPVLRDRFNNITAFDLEIYFDVNIKSRYEYIVPIYNERAEQYRIDNGLPSGSFVDPNLVLSPLEADDYSRQNPRPHLENGQLVLESPTDVLPVSKVDFFKARLPVLYTFFGSGSATRDEISFEKFSPVSKSRPLPLIRLQEMYLIAAEAGGFSTGLNYLNQLRQFDGLSEITSVLEEDYENLILEEYRKEFISEGQLFYVFKRKNLDSFSTSGGFTPIGVSTDDRYVLPIPSAEGF